MKSERVKFWLQEEFGVILLTSNRQAKQHMKKIAIANSPSTMFPEKGKKKKERTHQLFTSSSPNGEKNENLQLSNIIFF